MQYIIKVELNFFLLCSVWQFYKTVKHPFVSQAKKAVAARDILGLPSLMKQGFENVNLLFNRRTLPLAANQRTKKP